MLWMCIDQVDSWKAKTVLPVLPMLKLMLPTGWKQWYTMPKVELSGTTF